MVTLSAAPSFAPDWVRAMALALGNALPDPLDEAFCECVARIGCVRVGLLIKSGTLYALVGDDPPEREECAATCRSCDAQLLGRDCGRLLCARCRSSTTVEHGAPLIDTMYRSANPKFVLSPEMEAIAASIVRQRKVALQEHMLARHLAHRAYVVYERWKGGSGLRGRSSALPNEPSRPPRVVRRRDAPRRLFPAVPRNTRTTTASIVSSSAGAPRGRWEEERRD